MKLTILISILVFFNSYPQQNKFMFDLDENMLNKKISNFDKLFFDKMKLNEIYVSYEENWTFFNNKIEEPIFTIEKDRIKIIKINISKINNPDLINEMINRYGEYKYNKAIALQSKSNEATDIMSWSLKKFKLVKRKNKYLELTNEDKKLIIWEKGVFVIIYKERGDNISIVYQLK